jgi:hypothetical protein
MLHILLDAAQSVQGLGSKLTYSHYSNLSTQLKDLSPNACLSKREVGESSNGHWNGIQVIRNKLQPKVGVEGFYTASEKLAVGAITPDRSDWLVTPNCL